MTERFRISAVRLLKNIFRVGLFENPYLDAATTDDIVGNAEFMKSGYEAQLKSVVLLKNKEALLPLDSSKSVYIPQRYFPSTRGYFGPPSKPEWKDAMNKELAANYFHIEDDPAKADVAIVVIHSPNNGRGSGYSQEDAATGANGFVPISLQYEDYTATDARETSLAGDARETDVLNRSYKDKTVSVKNKKDLELIRSTRKLMKGKPVIVILKVENPTVVNEFEADIDALLVNFEVQDQAMLDILSGKAAPSGLLPLQMPASMAAVEAQLEDVPMDIEVHKDTEGNAYDFAFGLNWDGIIQDARTEKYKQH
jgi:beta-glucosidase